MFTGIIETQATLEAIRDEGSNRHFTFSSNISSELKIDQSLAHNGVCLTVVDINAERYTVTAIAETLKKSNLGRLSVSERVNVERCMKADGRFDGHIVQGHVDCTAECVERKALDGSTVFRFRHPEQKGFVTVEKGSITVDGVSLTVVDSRPGEFSVHIIPYTLAHTSFGVLQAGRYVNLEFDVIGKYVARMLGNI